MDFSPDDSRASFELALGQAQNSFLSELKFSLDLDVGATGVAFDLDTKKSVLMVNYSDPMASWLVSQGVSLNNAWTLILAHETGHMRLNSICHANGENPSNPDAQLKAIGIDQADCGASAIADFQKETAIESFCDACAGNAAIALLGQDWRPAVAALRDYRSNTSKELGMFSGDEYATWPSLDELLRRKNKMDPQEAARIALEHSIRNNSILKKSAVAAAVNLAELRASLINRLGKWRGARKPAKTIRPRDGPRPPKPRA